MSRHVAFDELRLLFLVPPDLDGSCVQGVAASPGEQAVPGQPTPDRSPGGPPVPASDLGAGRDHRLTWQAEPSLRYRWLVHWAFPVLLSTQPNQKGVRIPCLPLNPMALLLTTVGPTAVPSPERWGLAEVIAETETVRALLQDASVRTARLVAALKNQRRQSRVVRQAMESLRQFQLDR